MKKRLLVILVIALLTGLLISCGNDQNDPLDTPVGVSLEDHKILWDAVEGATSYGITVNGTTEQVTETFYELEPDFYGPIDVEVQALSEKRQSERSDVRRFVVELQLAIPTNIRLGDEEILWDEVENASSYDVWIDDILFNVATNRIGLEFDEPVIVKVRAVSDQEGLVESEQSSETLLGTVLDAPTNLVIEDGMLEFDPVTDAVSYEIYFDDAYHETIDSTTYVIPTVFLEQEGVLISVRALATDGFRSPKSASIQIDIVTIDSADDLMNMNEHGVYALGADIEVTENFVPIVFGGMLDGQGHTITVMIDFDGTYVGFFARLENATIRDLQIIGELNSTNTHHAPRVGGLAGYVEGSTIENVTVNMDLELESMNGIAALGGFVGEMTDSWFEYVAFNGTITGTNAIVGGLVGRMDDAREEALIFRSSVTAVITSFGGEQAYAGGFIGYLNDNTATIRESKAHIDLIGTSYAGGFIGYFGSGTIEDSYAEGSVRATNDVVVHAGGFIGRLEGYNVMIVRSIAMTEVTANATGEHVRLGAFSGVTVGGTYHTVYENVYYDTNRTSLDRIGNPDTGRGDGIASFDSMSVYALDGFDESLWHLDGEPYLNWETESSH